MDEVRLIERITKAEENIKSNQHRIDDVEHRQDKLDNLCAAMASVQTKVEHINGSMTKVEQKLSALEEKPAKRWDTVVVAIVTAIISTVIGAAIAKFL